MTGTPEDGPSGPRGAPFRSSLFSESFDEEEDNNSQANGRVSHNAEALAMQKERLELANRESGWVNWLRALVALLLGGTAIGVSVAVYRFTRKDQQDEFRHEFETYATKVLEAFTVSAQSQLSAIDALGSQMTSYARDSGSVWPNVTFPDFEIWCGHTRVLADAAVINWQPLVTDDTRAGWEAYFAANVRTYDDTVDKEHEQVYHQDVRLGHVPEDAPMPPAPNMTADGILWNITNWVTDPEQDPVAPPGSGPYLPIWQQSPSLPWNFVLNLNVLSHALAGATYRKVIETGQVALDQAGNLNEEEHGVSAAYFGAVVAAGQYRYNADAFVGDPTTGIGYPVFDSFDTTSRQVTGLLVTVLYWRLYFMDVLPDAAKGIVCVLENKNYDQLFTYRIDGEVAVYLGEGDLHDPHYNPHKMSANLAAFLKELETPETQAFTAVGINTELSDYDLHVYPSKDTEDEFVNNDPLYFTLVLVALFLFTSLVFAMYDCIVQRRQRIVMDRALASGAIVSSLFPEQVKKQLYEERKQKQKQEKPQENKAILSKVANAASATTGLLGVTTANNIDPNTTAPVATRPNAALYEETSIYFADLKGFTAWSSKRTPIEVFELLEALYGAFDKVAKRRHVFKVETIGDCYLAVTGIPEPQKKHAVIMCRFARECMLEMNKMTHRLADSLGEDTKTLQLRTGIHSGSTTAGVLRGEKGRFQLFGDTVNTASRMESTGEGGKIQCSNATADALKEEGKDSWLTEREGGVEAKGKGRMKTYWVSIKSMGSTTSGGSGTTGKTDEDDEDIDDTTHHDDQAPLTVNGFQ